MRNIFIIGLVVVALGYMFSIMLDKYDAAVKEQEKQRAIEKK